MPEFKMLNDFILCRSPMNSSSYMRFGKFFPVVSPVSISVCSKSKDIDLGKIHIMSIACNVNYIGCSLSNRNVLCSSLFLKINTAGAKCHCIQLRHLKLNNIFTCKHLCYICISLPFQNVYIHWYVYELKQFVNQICQT